VFWTQLAPTRSESFILTKFSARQLALPLLIIATFGVYERVTHHEFVGLDDGAYVFENDRVLTGLNLESLQWAFTTTRASNWHPLTWLSHMLDVQLFGRDPRGHHLVNLLFHIANTAFLFLVLQRMTKAIWPSAAVAALFALHPLHVESVAWVAERKDVLSTFFWLLTMSLYARYVASPAAGRYLQALLVFALGLMAKPMLVALPFVLLLLDYWPLRRTQVGSEKRAPRRKRRESGLDLRERTTWLRLLWEKIPFFALSALSSVVTILAQRSGKAIVTMESLPIGLRLENALVSYVGYIAKTLWPHPLAVYYPHPGEISIWAATGAGLLLVGLSFLAIRAGRRYPYLPIGWLWFVGTLVPVIGLVQVGEQAMADRYTYVPLIGLFIVLVWGAAELATRWRLPRVLLLAVVGVLLIALSVQTWAQVGHWRNTERLFEHTLRVTTDNSMAHTALAGGLFHQGRLEEAVTHYRKALEIDPEYARAHHNLGATLVRQGHLTEAIERYAEAVRLDPDHATYHVGLATALHRVERMDEAIEHYLEALRIEPHQADALNNLGVARMSRGELDQAIRAYSEAIRTRPAYTEAHYNLGYALSLQGKFEEAVGHYEGALRINPEDADTHYELGETLRRLGQLDPAIAHYSEALRLDPEYPGAHESLREASSQKLGR
jgi:tetratricopeptide (TPR) repeat protein